jgi:hypothetical protein
VGFALAGAKADERQVLMGILADPALAAGRTASSSSATRTTTGTTSRPPCRWPDLPAASGPPRRAGTGRHQFFKPLRQFIESINDTFKGSLTWKNTAGTPQLA